MKKFDRKKFLEVLIEKRFFGNCERIFFFGNFDRKFFFPKSNFEICSGFSKMLLAGWDYSIIDPHMAQLQKRANIARIREKLNINDFTGRNSIYYTKAISIWIICLGRGLEISQRICNSPEILQKTEFCFEILENFTVDHFFPKFCHFYWQIDLSKNYGILIFLLFHDFAFYFLLQILRLFLFLFFSIFNNIFLWRFWKIFWQIFWQLHFSQDLWKF